MAKAKAARSTVKATIRINQKPKSAEVVNLLKSSSQTLELDFWARVLLLENRHLRMSVEEMRERIIARIEYVILNGGEADQSAAANLGVPTFAELVRANADEFCSKVVRKVQYGV